jgi:hypothetical protein
MSLLLSHVIVMRSVTVVIQNKYFRYGKWDDSKSRNTPQNCSNELAMDRKYSYIVEVHFTDYGYMP